MDVRQLAALVAVAETGSVTRAAEVLHLVQPAVSRQVRLLEDELGAPLFERTRQGMRLTDDGQILLGARPPGAERAGAGARGDPSGVGRAARRGHPRPVAQLRRADLGGVGGPVGGRASERTAAAVDRVHAASRRLAGRRGHRPGRDLRGPAVLRGGGASAARRVAVGGGSAGLGPVPGPSGPFHRRPRAGPDPGEPDPRDAHHAGAGGGRARRSG